MSKLYAKYKKLLVIAFFGLGFVVQLGSGYYVYDKFEKIDFTLRIAQSTRMIALELIDKQREKIEALENKIKKLGKKLWK